MAKTNKIVTKPKHGKPNMDSVFKKLNALKKENKILKAQIATSERKRLECECILGK